MRAELRLPPDTPERGQAMGGEAVGDPEGLSQALAPWLHTQTAGNTLFSGRLPETYERVRSMPRLDTTASLLPQEGTLGGAGLP